MSIRTEQVASTLHKGISEIIQKELTDPRLKLVTITHIKVAGDLRFATLYASFLDNSGKDSDAFKALKKSMGFIKARLPQYVRLRYVPHLEVVYDDTGRKAEKIERIMHKVRSANDSEPTL